MPFNFSGFGGASNDPAVMGWNTTQETDYSTNPLSSGLPSNVVEAPRSNGVTFSGILDGVSATADSLFKTFGKVYQLQSDVEDAKFQRVVNEANMDLKRAQTMGTLDIQRATIDANIAIEKARAGRATEDALARVNSGSAGFIVQTSKVSPLMIIGGLVLAGAFLFFNRGKK
jgi:hypothetical protein